jgi:hypothetical protein
MTIPKAVASHKNSMELNGMAPFSSDLTGSSPMETMRRGSLTDTQVDLSFFEDDDAGAEFLALCNAKVLCRSLERVGFTLNLWAQFSGCDCPMSLGLTFMTPFRSFVYARAA